MRPEHFASLPPAQTPKDAIRVTGGVFSVERETV
jgi:hypothetical protein